MEIELIGQSQKPASLQDLQVEQMRKQNLVIRPYKPVLRTVTINPPQTTSNGCVLAVVRW